MSISRLVLQFRFDRIMIENFKTQARKLKKEVYTLNFVYKDSRISWWKKLYLGIVIGYFFSPIDLIPDFIPILGYLDDLILIPLGISIAIKLIPKEVDEESRRKATEGKENEIPTGKKTALIIICIWIFGLSLFLLWLIAVFGSN